MNPDNNSGQAGNVGTGVTGVLPMAGAAALFLLCAAGLMVLVSKKQKLD